MRILISEDFDSKTWYHGTPDSREIQKVGGFSKRTTTVTYVENVNGYNEHMDKLKNARQSGDDKLYHQLLSKTSDFKKEYTYNTPIFLSDKKNVASTYADPKRAFDYQGAVEKVYEVKVNCSKKAIVFASGQRFRFLNIDPVKKGFVDSGQSEETINNLIAMFNYNVKNKRGIETDKIGAIAHYLGYDCVDVVGVLDSYHGGKTKSTVKMVFDPSNIKIINI